MDSNNGRAQRGTLPSPGTNGLTQRGPYVILDLEEKHYLKKRLSSSTDPVGQRIHAKVTAALNTDPVLLKPL